MQLLCERMSTERTRLGRGGAGYLGEASDSVPFQVTVLHAWEGPEYASYHLLCSTLRT